MTYVETILADSPVYYYRLQEASGLSAVDSSTHGRDGTYAGAGVTYGVTGATAISDGGKAVNVSPDAYIDTGVDSPCNPAGDFTIEAWIRRDGPPDFNATFAGKYNISGDQINAGVSNFGNVKFKINSTEISSVATVTNNAWRHLVCTRASGVLKIYIDGVLDTSNGSVVGALAPGGNVFLGKLGVQTDIESGIGPCDIDEAAWYNTALTPDRILAHFQAATAIPSTDSDTGIPIACWWPSHHY